VDYWFCKIQRKKQICQYTLFWGPSAKKLSASGGVTFDQSLPGNPLSSAQYSRYRLALAMSPNYLGPWKPPYNLSTVYNTSYCGISWSPSLTRSQRGPYIGSLPSNRNIIARHQRGKSRHISTHIILRFPRIRFRFLSSLILGVF